MRSLRRSRKRWKVNQFCFGVITYEFCNDKVCGGEDYYMCKRADRSIIDLMIIDIGTPVSLMRRGWIDGYLKEMKVDKSKVYRQSCVRWFWIGKMLYLREVEKTFPIVMNTLESDYIKREVTTKILVWWGDLLVWNCNTEELEDIDMFHQWNFDNKKKHMDLMGSSGSHRLVRLELVGT